MKSLMNFPDLPGFESKHRRGAIFGHRGDIQAYRYRLTRQWGEGECVNFVMLNPSTADALTDDNTIIRCTNFAKAWGYDGLVVTNLYALRSTDPRGLWSDPSPVGPENEGYIIEAASEASLIIAAWGTHGAVNDRGKVVLALLRSHGHTPMALRFTKDGHPCHPLRLPANLRPVVIGGAP